MNEFETTDRSRLAEDEYFRRRDEEILRRAREIGETTRERAELAKALATPDLTVAESLYAHGLRASTAALVEWLPAVEVAWLDGADEAERHALRVHVTVDGRASTEGIALLDSWLTQRPPETLFAAGRVALRARLHALDAVDREALMARILALCEATGRAAGGYFGLGSLSSDERSHIAGIQEDLARPL
jgi:hypothetical protein